LVQYPTDISVLDLFKRAFGLLVLDGPALVQPRFMPQLPRWVLHWFQPRFLPQLLMCMPLGDTRYGLSHLMFLFLRFARESGWVEPVQPRLMPQLLGTVHPARLLSRKKCRGDTSLKLCGLSWQRFKSKLKMLVFSFRLGSVSVWVLIASLLSTGDVVRISTKCLVKVQTKPIRKNAWGMSLSAVLCQTERGSSRSLLPSSLLGDGGLPAGKQPMSSIKFERESFSEVSLAKVFASTYQKNLLACLWAGAA